MPSQIKVDEIKNVAGQYKIKTDVVEGQTTAGSITVQGEGTATTNLQQGLAKAWSLTNTDASSIDSFNYTSNTDNATGDYSHGLTNNMNSASYAVPATCGQDSSVFGINKARATNSVRVMNIVYSNGAIDVQQVHAVHGDLA